MDGYDATNANKVKECQDKAWDELVAMIGVLGVNDIKYKSMKEELKVDYSKGHCNYPKTIPSLKQQLDGRRWAANPNSNTRGNGKTTGLSKEAKEAKEALIEAGAVPQSNLTQHQTNGTKLQECLYFKKSLLSKMEEMHLPLLPLKPVGMMVGMVVDLEGDPVDPVDRVVAMIEDLEEDLEDPAAAVAAAVVHHPYSAKWHTPLVY